ncbi:hypothetical protein ES703_68385 [subsurface metagenome]
MAKALKKQLVINAMRAIGTIQWKERSIYLFKGYEDIFYTFLKDYLIQNKAYTFVGLPHMVRAVGDCAIEPANTNLWKVSTSADWVRSLTGLGTFDEIFPETGSKKLRLKKDPNHWAMVFGFLEVGSNRIINRIQFTDINGAVQSIMTPTYQVLTPDLRYIKLNPAIKLKSLYTLDINIEGIVAGDTEIVPVALHILPHQIVTSTDQSGYVEEA